MEEKDDKIPKYARGIYGDPAIPSQKLTRNKDYYGQIRLSKKKLIEFLSMSENEYIYLDMFIQKENRKRLINNNVRNNLRFIVVDKKRK